MPRKTHQSPSSTNKTGSSKDIEESRESTPGMAPTTPATSVHSTTPQSNGLKAEDTTPAPSDDNIITKEMIKEEEDLHQSAEQKELADSSQQVLRFALVCGAKWH